jgi:8-oxo-dGTP pyrophosphatase MutT (NUDIX family)
VIKTTHAGGAVFRQKEEVWEMLVTKRTPEQSYYFLPNGARRAGESELQTARREVAEETGVKVGEPYADLGLVVRGGVDDHNRRYTKVIRYFLFLTDDTHPPSWSQVAEKDKTFFVAWQPVKNLTEDKFLYKEKTLLPLALKFLDEKA